MNRSWLAAACMALLLAMGCAGEGAPPPADASAQAGEPTAPPTRANRLPADVAKVTPATDVHPPQLHSQEWETPVPLPAPVNTAGAEDSPFITPDGTTLYFFFTPDPRVPPQKQLVDGVSGIWVSRQEGGAWTEPARVVLQDDGKLALDGAPTVAGDVFWFCSAREGYTGVNLFTARRKDGRWRDWQYVGDRLMKTFATGEMHLTADGALYFHSPRPGGKGQYDIWVTRRVGDEWQEPANVAAVNSDQTDGWPFVTRDGRQLWFTRTHRGAPAIFRSRRTDGRWGPPEMILSMFAGEPTLDEAGNLYFAHHFIRDDRLVEADIYVARKKPVPRDAKHE